MDTTQPPHCPHCDAPVDPGPAPPGQTIACPGCGRPVVVPGPAEQITGRQVYNVVTDVGAGPNLRLSDNLLQLAAIGIGAVLGAGIGLVVGSFLSEPVLGAVAGAAIGFLLGFFGSGFFLMIYRALCHANAHPEN